MKRGWIIIGLLLILQPSVWGQIDSQWRGPNRDGVYPNETLLKTWPEGGPRMIWSTEILGKGYSSAAVTSDRVYVTGMIDGTGTLFAFDMKGKLIWKSNYGPEWQGDRSGTRTTPTVVGDRIYLVSGMGQVVCFDTNGKTVWSVDMIKEFNGINIRWGFAESPLVDGDRIFCTPGAPQAAVVALNRHTGQTIWKIKTNGDQSAYCSPCIVRHGDRRLLLTMTQKSVIGIDADTGEYLWHYSHVTEWDINPNTPFYHNGFMYVTSGYGTGGQMFKISKDGGSIEPVWSQNILDSQMGAFIFLDGYIYGSGHNKRYWHCLDWNTGKVQFSERALGNKGNIITSDGMLYCYGENGEVGLVKPNPQKFEVVSSFKVKMGSAEHWSHPVIKNGRLYVRHGEALMVYDISR
jgi:outer membrane protein assembly factor BamB